MALNQTLMILSKTVTFCSVHLNHLTLSLTIDHFSGFRPDAVWPRAGVQTQPRYTRKRWQLLTIAV